MRQVEHILPVKHYPRFSLTMKNLAVACSECNSHKGDKKWWKIKESSVYPDSSLFKNAFHHHFHEYDEHVRWFRYTTNEFSFSIYGGLTNEGRALCQTLLNKVVKAEISLIRDDGMSEALKKIEEHNTLIKPLPNLEAFLSELRQKIMP